MKRLLWMVLALWLPAFGSHAGGDESGNGPLRNDYMVRYVVEDDFSFIRDMVIQGIADRGLKVNNVSHIGDMLERTGKDLGAGGKIYEHAEAIEFCSATVSRRMMEADPHNIVFCPYIVYIYQLPGEGRTWIAYRIPRGPASAASRSALRAVEELLQGIIGDAVGL